MGTLILYSLIILFMTLIALTFNITTLTSPIPFLTCHLRHLSDHFVKIVDTIGDKSSVIEFDDRQPGGILEEDPDVALQQVNTLKSRICHLTTDELDQVVKVAFMAHPREHISDNECKHPNCFQIPSSIARELSFATHHG